MNMIRNLVTALGLSLGAVVPASFAQVGVSVSIGINVPAYPQLVPVAGYPVYYAPRLGANYFFYDGLYWVYVNDNWYDSVWYDGPWTLVVPELVPVYILRVPVRYYVRPPPYFHAWAPAAPPRWGERFGPAWEQHHHGWDRWNRASAPPPAPLPTYQRQYAGDRYPRIQQQQESLHSQHYRYQPKESVARQHYEHMSLPAAPPPRHEASRQDSQPQRAAPVPQRHEERAAPLQAQRPLRDDEAQGARRERQPAPGRAEGKQNDNDREKGKQRDEREK